MQIQGHKPKVSRTQKTRANPSVFDSGHSVIVDVPEEEIREILSPVGCKLLLSMQNNNPSLASKRFQAGYFGLRILLLAYGLVERIEIGNKNCQHQYQLTAKGHRLAQ